ncbi:hypothetical protein [Telmatospirillum sp.]|uniref:hypothetical protein n=1 Tax=Telmatospirillum sp. TaxID=2079197 RepID=UPI002849402C|nr:hypothetical protein [Telmatospirillum sp.]MDR3440217.1 hypothetical protein [Telmatospirillum sp.]
MVFSACNPEIAASGKSVFSLPPLPRGGRGDGNGFRGAEEPTLSDILQDPVFHRILASDGVKQDHLLALIDTIRSRLSI